MKTAKIIRLMLFVFLGRYNVNMFETIRRVQEGLEAGPGPVPGAAPLQNQREEMEWRRDRLLGGSQLFGFGTPRPPAGSGPVLLPESNTEGEVLQGSAMSRKEENLRQEVPRSVTLRPVLSERPHRL